MSAVAEKPALVSTLGALIAERANAAAEAKVIPFPTATGTSSVAQEVPALSTTATTPDDAVSVKPVVAGAGDTPLQEEHVGGVGGACETSPVTMIRDAAMAYHRRGWKLIPIKYETKDIPLLRWGGEKLADEVLMAKEATIRHRFGRDLANVAVATGHNSGLWILDIDGPAGRESLAKLEAEHGALPDGPCVTTGRADGGAHRYFIYPQGRDLHNSAGKVAPGIDVRAAGGYALLPPSKHPSGAFYTWEGTEDMPLPEAPAWLLSMVEAAGRGDATPTARQTRAKGGAVPALPDVGSAAKQSIVDRIESAYAKKHGATCGEGNRHGYVLGFDRCLRGEPKLAGDTAFIERSVALFNLKRCDPPLEHAEIEQTVFSTGPRIMPDVNAVRTAGALFPETNDKGRPLGTIENFRILLGLCDIRVSCDTILKERAYTINERRAVGEDAENIAIAQLASAAARYEYPQTNIGQFLLAEARRHEVNPIRDWIVSKPWDGRARVGELADALETPPGFSRELVGLYLRKFLLSAVVAACHEDGVPFAQRGVLVLQGRQNIGKSRFLRSLCSSPQYFKTIDSLDARNRDGHYAAISCWIAELGELDGTLSRSDLAALKSFLTAPSDSQRRPYARAETHYERRSVYAASVNSGEFLNDPTGSTRFLVIPVTAANPDHRVNMQQLYRDLYEAWREGGGERWWLEGAELEQQSEANEAFEAWDAMDDLLATRFDWAFTRQALADGEEDSLSWASTNEILELLGYSDVSKRTTALCRALAAKLRKLIGMDAPKRTATKRLWPYRRG
jgi:hypothetical protein